MDISFVMKILFSVMGGLGIFLLGMKNMSEGMQSVAGDKLRKLINAVTNNRLIACGVGTGVTCVIQSSSVTSVMVVGMVNAGLMTLVQAIGVILGANIGTTITSWILVLKIGKYGLPLLGLSAFFYLFSKRERVRFMASTVMGLGMIFFGLELMKAGFSPLKDLPEFIDWFSRFRPDTYFGVLKCCLVGAVLTAIVQSSSATIGITMGLAFTGVIDYYTAAALVLGENIGTTITALLASIGASDNAKRAAYAHTLVNVLGVLLITAIFPYYTKLIIHITANDPFQTVYSETATTYPYALKAIAATHTVFNVTNAILWLPLIGLLSKLLFKVVPQEGHGEPHLKYLDIRLVDAPAIGIEQSRKEIIFMGQVVKEMMRDLRKVLGADKSNKELHEKIFKKEAKLDIIQKEVAQFLSNVLSGNISHEVVERGTRQMRMADEYESVSDYITAILKLRIKMTKNSQKISPEGLEDLNDLHDRVSEYIDLINDAVENNNIEVGFYEKFRTMGTSITKVMKTYRSSHLKRVEKGAATALKSLFFTDMLNSYRRIKDHAFNIAEVLAGEK